MTGQVRYNNMVNAYNARQHAVEKGYVFPQTHDAALIEPYNETVEAYNARVQAGNKTTVDMDVSGDEYNARVYAYNAGILAADKVVSSAGRVVTTAGMMISGNNKVASAVNMVVHSPAAGDYRKHGNPDDALALATAAVSHFNSLKRRIQAYESALAQHSVAPRKCNMIVQPRARVVLNPARVPQLKLRQLAQDASMLNLPM